MKQTHWECIMLITRNRITRRRIHDNMSGM